MRRWRGWTVFLGVFLYGLGVFAQQYPSSVASMRPSNPASEVITVPFELVRGMIFVQAEINGSRGTFILDTGSPCLILHADQPQGDARTMLSVSDEYHATETRVRHFQWAGMERKGLEALVMDISHLEENYEREIRGVIGYSVFSEREILIDIRNRRLLLSARHEQLPVTFGRSPVAVPFRLEAHLPVVRVQLGGSNYRFGFDSGCSVNLMSHELLNQLEEEHCAYIREQELHGFTADPVRTPVVQVSGVQVGALPVSNMEFSATDLSRFRDSGLSIDGLLGYPFFREHLISIDYNRAVLRFWSSSAADPIR